MIEHSAFFDPLSSTLTYVIWDPVSLDTVIIDPVLDYDPATQLTSYTSYDRVLHFVRSKELHVHWILETHAHADHLSAGRELRQVLTGSQWGMGRRMTEVFETFRKVLAWPSKLELKGLGVDRFFADGEEFTAGTLRLQSIATPGHTPACVTYKIGEWLFTGDALFMPDSGVGRCDFPGGSASTLYDSVWGKVFSYPGHFRIFVGHDYQPGGRPLRYHASVEEQRKGNVHLRESISRAEFVSFREGRDKTLSSPRLLQPSLDWNLGAHQIVKPN
ncbi:MAG: MBL fold metallo-hydrolase [Bdellovibrionales bacterium]|nr:MBL fold metallo-hydrolase [Bdellovibrionales bacterium]